MLAHLPLEKSLEEAFPGFPEETHKMRLSAQ
jgi:hypothetical protein